MVTWYSTHCGARSARYIKGQKYTLLSRKKNLTLDGKKALKTFGGSWSPTLRLTCAES
jgi:hypothetical protein